MMSAVDRATQKQSTRVSLLAELMDAHAELLQAIEQLERLTRGPRPSNQVLDDARWKISKASLARRRLWGRIQAHLSAVVDRDAATKLRHLQDLEIRLIRASVEHIARWPNKAVLNDWPGYCRASADMRSKLADMIIRERRILYPMLGSLGD